MTETARVLLTAAVLSTVMLAVVARRLLQTAPRSPSRLVAQLHLSQWAALVLAVQGALTLGLAVAGEGGAGSAREAITGIVPIAVAVLVLRQEPRTALWLAAVTLGLHATLMFAHRPGWWSPELAPAWLWAGRAIYDLCVAVLCTMCAGD